MRPPISQLDLDAYPSLEAGSPMSWEPSQTPANQESVSLHSPVKPGLWGQRSVGRRVQKGQSASSLVPALRGRTTEDHSSRKRLSCHHRKEGRRALAFLAPAHTGTPSWPLPGPVGEAGGRADGVFWCKGKGRP